MNLKPVEHQTLPKPLPGEVSSLYIHIPFCETLCPYCSFNRFVSAEETIRTYFHSLREEMGMVKRLGYCFDSIYIGGGTPTIVMDELLKTIDYAQELFSVQEVSCETNPNHLEPDVIRALSGKVQRLSVGVQTFEDDLLRSLTRYDRFGSGAAILRKIETAAPLFPLLNIDMIFNFPTQTIETVRQDTRLAISSGANQVTFYPLMSAPSVERSLAQTVGKVDYQREAEMYQVIIEELGRAFIPLSAWTFSRNGGEMIDEYIVDHDNYLGVGSGAFSYLNGVLFVNTFSLKDYTERITAGCMSVSASYRFDLTARMRYRFMMEMFSLKINKNNFQKSFGGSIDRKLWLEMLYMRLMGAFMKEDEQQIWLSPRGRYYSVAMMREFFANINQLRERERKNLVIDELAEKKITGTQTRY